ncbi:hypothetical protein Pla175_00130 [Pirellulimonas nuda]|uniref:DUF4159 domain-containing protein n=1 Tax=Pirellulimonas nuda TaxID=2528009 RepID=A0A518D5C1_9BACT|nr:DUF4159 domain-containing protein [Pirellulimonas nuda]QDU86663.1 hypothetical protein Pla175_00130 [Pirellulimonas nuda]
MNYCRRATLVALLLALLPGPTRAAEPPLDAATVLSTIDRGVAYLKQAQSSKGRWDELPTYAGGTTALCTLALLDAGVEPSDPVITKALAYLRTLEPEKTYVTALQTMVLATADPDRDRILIQRNVEWLEANQIKEGDKSGAWSYPGASGDNSNAQFALLGLYEAQRVGAVVQDDTWRRALDYWRRTQNPDGSWGYLPGWPGSGSMTCAGIGAVEIASAAIDEGDARVVGGVVQCCVPHERNDSIDRAVAWLSTQFSVRRNPGPAGMGQQFHLYYLYGVERAGRLTANRFFGDHDWYREGTGYLVDAQDPLSHYWVGGMHQESNPHIGSPLALLFLAKGRWPTLMAKLKHGPGDDWDNHRRDAMHLTREVEKAWKMPLTYQVIDPQKAEVEDLLQAPVLYLSGSKTPDLTALAPKLRDYVDRGGFIFIESCCGESRGWRTGVERLVEAMFPEPEYRLRQLRPAHPLWKMERIVRPESEYVGKLWAVEYGCRTCVVMCDADLSCYWELDRPGRAEKYPAKVRERIEDAATIGLNVLAYATGREPKGKEQSLELAPPPDAISDAGDRGVFQVAKLSHGGGCDDAPGALANLLRAAAQGDTKLRVEVLDELISAGDARLFERPMAFMHGRHTFRFTAAERRNLKQYLERGGTLLADSICASNEFTAAFRKEIAAALPGASLERIPADDPLLTRDFGGYSLERVELRDPQPVGDNEPLAAKNKRVEPQLEGIRIGDRWAVVFSQYDLSCALEQHVAIECRGYSKEDAARIGLNVMLYVINQ